MATLNKLLALSNPSSVVITMSMARDFLAANGRVAIFFRKEDGSMRILYGTNHLAMIPSDKHPQGLKPQSTTAIAVFDLTINEWRSFRVDRLIQIEVLEPLVGTLVNALAPATAGTVSAGATV